MKKIDKYGWTFIGTIGGILALGGITLALQKSKKIQESLFRSKKSKDFALSLIILVASIMKAEGRPMKSELEFTKRFFLKKFGKETTSDAILILREILKQEIEIKYVCEQISYNLEYAERLQLLHFLFGLANADQNIRLNEFFILEQISDFLKLEKCDYASIKSMFFNDIQSAYNVLEVPLTAAENEIKQAYRKMALKYHPDKMAYLGAEVLADANEKFKKVNEAYEKIKKERNIT